MAEIEVDFMELAKAVVTDHALVQMARRAIDEKTLRAVLAQPENVEHVRPGRVVAQAPDGEYLLRVFVDVDRDPPEVVTAYKTSKMGKYRRLQ